MHGAGIHCHPSGGKLDMHLDYGIHPRSGKERRLNLIIYLNKDWKDEYGGELQFWDDEMQMCQSSHAPTFNRAVLFRTCDVSYHGMPNVLSCPGTTRKSLAVYYVSDARPAVQPRYKAMYVPRPSDVKDAFMDGLRGLRVERRLTEADLGGWRPTWEVEL
eukprot:1160774-Pelagomonas_calceolata.AAC.9